MGLINLVLDFYDGYYFATGNLDRLIKQGKDNAYSNEPHQKAEGLNLNPISVTGGLTALVLNPSKTAKYFRQYLFPILEDRIVVLKEFKQYCKSRHLQI